MKLPQGFQLETTSEPGIKLPPGFQIDTAELAPAKSATLAETAIDMAKQVPAGVNRGLHSILSLPHTASSFVARKVGADDLADRWAHGGSSSFDSLKIPGTDFSPGQWLKEHGQDAETLPGRIVGGAMEAVGGAALPTAGLMAAAPGIAARAVTAPARTAVGGVVQSAATNIAAAPGAALAMDAASAAAGGASGAAAKEGGLSPTMQAIAQLAGSFVPGIGMAYARPTTTGIGTPTGRNVAQQRADATVADAAAFEAQGVRPFGPAFNQGPVASVGKQLTETPFVGAPLKNALDETYHDMAAASQRLARNIAPAATNESAGAAVQGGLERFKTARLQDLEPGVVRNLQIEPVSPVPNQAARSQGAIRAAEDAQPIRQQIGADTAQTSRGVTVPSARPLNETMTARTGIDHLDDAALTRVIRAPADHTSFGTRQEALYERARRSLPEIMRTDGRTNPNLVNTANTRQVMAQIEGNITDQISGQSIIRGPLFERFRNAQSNFQINDLFRIRTEVGRALGKAPSETTLDKSQLKQIYAAVSRDIEVGIETLANRAAIVSQRPGAHPDAVQTAQQAAGALNSFRTADRYTRGSMERMDRFSTLMNAEKPEAVSRLLVNAATSGNNGNIRQFRAAMGVLRPEERSQFAALIVQDMGAPVASARGIVQEAGFSAQSFVTRYQKMTPEARGLLFTPEHRQSLDQLFAVANRIAGVEALANTSRSGTNAMNIGGLVSAGSSLARGDVVTPIMIGTGGLATSLLMASPSYVNWMTRYVQMRAAIRSGRDQAVAPMIKHVMQLDEMARANPTLAPAIEAVRAETEHLRQNPPKQLSQAESTMQAVKRLADERQGRN
jgi:hypothetical protein